MQNFNASRTAMATALIRAHHTKCDPEPLVVDPWGDVLVPQDFKDRLAERAAEGAEVHGTSARELLLDRYLAAIPSYASVVLRSRYAEDELEKAARSGVAQYVSVGAGFDSFSLRRPGYAAQLRVFEVDHPATQNLKRRRLLENGIAEPRLTYFVAADLAEESLATALRRSPFRFGEQAFFAWLGVTIYLPLDANSMALRGFAECGASGSLVVFTYTDERAFNPETESTGFRRMRTNAERLGEPFLTGFKPAEMAGYLFSLGLTLVEDLDGVELGRRYSNPVGHARFVMSRDSHVALARVA